jgi:ketosteroid isomerase-like protein
VSLQEADRAFADALMRHDRPAFVALFAADAESSLPSPKKGPEAIANSWLPFLIDQGTTMILTNTGVAMDPGGETGTTTGTFDIRGRTNNGIQTIPGGNYSIAWRIVDGQWRISSLAGSRRESTTAADRGGVGRYRFGMTRAEVSRVADCQPYTNVAVTGGLECANYVFEGQEMNISFLFTGDRLRRIQLWFYEGESESEARGAVGKVLEYLQRVGGGVSSNTLPAGEVNAGRVMEMLAGPPPPGRFAQVEISANNPQTEVWFSRIGRTPYGYGVMLFADPLGAR